MRDLGTLGGPRSSATGPLEGGPLNVVLICDDGQQPSTARIRIASLIRVSAVPGSGMLFPRRAVTW
jgi:hypothetical protein